MSGPALRTRHLRKVFRPRLGIYRRGPEKVAVDDVDLEIAPGELFTLLGKNGAGKTTLVKLLATLVLPTSGEAQIFGFDVERDEAAVRRLIGLASPEERSFFWRLTGRQNLEFYAALHGMRGRKLRAGIDDLVHRLDMTDFIDGRFDAFSSGMKQRVALARGLLGSPRLLFLDEPTRSLDPGAQRQARALIRQLASEGITILLVTHQLEEATELSNRIGLMEGGRLRILGPEIADLGALF